MNLIECRKCIAHPLTQATVLFLIRGDELLLAMKKRGFGAGRWNGVGGKALSGEAIEEAARRETEEEIGVRATSLRRSATLDFYFPHRPEWSQQVHAFLTEKWEGEPGESEEMAPQWFKLTEIPYKKMWSSDSLWLPKVLEGLSITAEFVFGEGDKVLEHEVREAND